MLLDLKKKKKKQKMNFKPNNKPGIKSKLTHALSFLPWVNHV